jgi:tetratricopeptide (TPR) repeat protein
MIRDGLKFLTLTLVAVALSGVTTFLFRSFESRREQLAVRWAQRGRDAMHQGHAEQAVAALRVSLSYRPDDYENQLALADALAAGGHVDEAENYFLNLWQSRPGDGPINLQLARLERSRGRALQAIDYYRAAVFGTWAGDAPAKRRDTRLELSRYLVERGEPLAAEAELLIAAGNNPDPATQLLIAEALDSAGDNKDALTAYRNAQVGEQAATAQARAGELCYRAGDYACAEDLLGKALRSKNWAPEQQNRLSGLHEDAVKLQELAFSPVIAPSLRSTHLLSGTGIVMNRFKTCLNVALAPLQARWKVLDTTHNRAALRRDEDLQTQYGNLIFETEAAAAKACGAPTGDDALLLHLQDHPMIRIGAQ